MKKKEPDIPFGVPRDVGDGVIEVIYPYDTWFEPAGKYRYAKRWGSYPVVKPEGAYVVEEMDIESGVMVKKLYLNVPDDVMAVLFQTDKKELKAQRDQEERMYWGDPVSGKDEFGDWHCGAMDLAAYEQYVHKENEPDVEEEYTEEELCSALSDNPKIRNAQVRYMCEIVRKVLPYLTKKNYRTFYQLFHQCLREADIARCEHVNKSAVSNRKNRLIAQIIPVFENLGFVIPTKTELKAEKAEAAKLGTVIQTSGERKINVAASKPAASWVEESGALVFSDASFDQKILDAYKLSVAVKVSEELLADNQYDLEGFLIRSFGQAIANAEEEAFLVGDGTSKPTGLLHPTLGGQISVTTAGNAVTADEVLDLIYKLKRPYRTGAAFIMADSTLAAIRKLKDGTGQYLWQPALTAGEPDRLLGYPVYTSQFVPAIAAGQPVMVFGDFSYYNIGDRGTRSFAALHELYAGVGQVAFVAKERVDGKLILPEAVQVLKMKGTAANG